MNTMTIKDFIDTQYPVIEKLKSRFSNIFAKIDNNDNLPYDIIGPDEDGNITKLVEVEEGRYVSVYDLLSMSKDDLPGDKDIALTNVWNTYMENVDIRDINIIDLLESVKAYNTYKNKREEQANVLGL